MFLILFRVHTASHIKKTSSKTFKFYYCNLSQKQDEKEQSDLRIRKAIQYGEILKGFLFFLELKQIEKTATTRMRAIRSATMSDGGKVPALRFA